MTNRQREEVDEALLERPRQALVNEAAQARKQTIRLREAAGEARRRHVAAIETADAFGGRVVHVLHEDPELAKALSEEDRRELTQALRAPLITVEDGSWQPPVYEPDRTYGLLVLDGLLGRRLRVGAATAIELLGQGDILRPWQKVQESAIPASVEWRILSPARIAVLDERVTRVIGRRPELSVAFSSRLLRRCQTADYLAAVGHLTRVEDRLLAVLWHLATNWGRVTPQGIRIPFRLTHQMLGELVGAKRPSVTIGLRYLREQGEVARSRDGRYLLTGTPPERNPERDSS